MAADKPWRKLALPFALQYVAPWSLYLLLLHLQADDRFAWWRGDVVWPAEHFMTVSQAGVAMPMFGHLMAGAIGGLFLAVIITAIVRLVCRLLRARDVSGPAGGAVIWLFPFWVFIFLKAVPEVVTVIDPAARTLAVHHHHPVLRYPTATTTLSGAELHALALTTHDNRASGNLYLQLVARTVDERVVLLAERACDAHDPEACMTAADPDVAELARVLARGSRPVDSSRADDHVHILTP